MSGTRAILIGASPALTGADLARAMRSLKVSARDLRVGVDGGVRAWKRLGHLPDLAVGDWDSLRKTRGARGSCELTLPRHKDRSDLYWACRAAVSAGATELVCLGVTGGRPDHHLATLFELSRIAQKMKGLTAVRVLDCEAEYCFLSAQMPPWRRRLPRGRTLSIFALGGAAGGVTLSGVEYRLQGARLPPSSVGLSNRAAGGFAKVELARGGIVVILPFLSKSFKF